MCCRGLFLVLCLLRCVCLCRWPCSRFNPFDQGIYGLLALIGTHTHTHSLTALTGAECTRICVARATMTIILANCIRCALYIYTNRTVLFLRVYYLHPQYLALIHLWEWLCVCKCILYTAPESCKIRLRVLFTATHHYTIRDDVF